MVQNSEMIWFTNLCTCDRHYCSRIYVFGQKQGHEPFPSPEDGFVVAETGWPQACPSNENRRPANLQNMCQCLGFVILFVPQNVKTYIWTIWMVNGIAPMYWMIGFLIKDPYRSSIQIDLRIQS